MKKILIFLPEFPVLTETFIERDISKLIELGNLDITVLYIKEGKGTMSENVRTHAVKHGLTLIDAIFGLRFILTRSDRVYDAFKLSLKDSSKLFPVNIFVFFKSLGYAHIFNNYKPDEIHGHFLSDPSTIVMLASKVLNVSFSVNAHAKDVLVYPSLPYEKAQLAKFITVCNINAFKKTVELAGGNTRIHLIYHGVDPQRIFPQDHIKRAHKEPRIFLGGTRLVEKKGIIHMIEASRILKDRGIAHTVHVAGPGPLYHEFLLKITEYGLEHIFYIHGEGQGMPFEDVAGMYLDADIFVYPGVETEEGDADGIPNVLIEAAFAKLPIVATDAGSITEFVNNENAVIVPQKDSAALADEVEKLIFDELRKRELGECAYTKASEMFNVERNVKELEALLLQ